MKIHFVFILLFVSFALSACGSKDEETPDVLLTPPAIMVEVSRENCPSIETVVGMSVAWRNVDTVPLPIKIERLDESGKVADTGKTELYPETVLTLEFYEGGIYHYYCTDADVFATITVK